jgi:hypothetical protein
MDKKKTIIKLFLGLLILNIDNTTIIRIRIGIKKIIGINKVKSKPIPNINNSDPPEVLGM